MLARAGVASRREVERLIGLGKVAVHEIGHTLGLEHCPTVGCLMEDARGTVLNYWLRIAPLDRAVSYLHTLEQAGKIVLPQPDAPGRYYGMRVDLAAEMEYFSPEDRLSLQRILFYGRGGFEVIDPRHFPYRQPDFRDPALIEATGNRPVPFMLLLRRMGRERQARLPIGEASVRADPTRSANRMTASVPNPDCRGNPSFFSFRFISPPISVAVPGDDFGS